MKSGWIRIADMKVDAGMVLVGAAEDAEHLPPLADLLEIAPTRAGLDLGSQIGLQFALVPAGYGDGIYPVEVRTIISDGEVIVTELRVRFVADEPI